MSTEGLEGFGLDRATGKPFVYDYTLKKKRYDLENMGYSQKMTLRVISAKQTFYQPVPNSTLIKKVETYVYKEFSVTAEPCLTCQTLEENFDYLFRQSIKSVCFRKCFKTRRTVLYHDLDNKKHFKLLSERPIDIPEIIKLVSEGKIDYIEDFGLIQQLEVHFDKTF